MFDFEKISISFSYSVYWLLLGSILAVLYAFYVYRFTLPPVQPLLRFILASLRAVAVILLLLILFEPVLQIVKKEVIQPVNLVFFDNSRSLTVNDGTERQAIVNRILDDLKEQLPSDYTEYFTFGSKTVKFDPDTLSEFDFSEPSTNFSKIINENDEIFRDAASVTIISDGVITEGSSPLYAAGHKAIPFYTVGIGDSSRKSDIGIRSVLHNDVIYAETPTSIMASINHTGYAGSTINASLYEDDILIEQKNLNLNESGINNIYFDYTPQSGGEKKLSLTISELQNEVTYANNKKIFYVNVFSNKIKVLILAGTPSPDITFIKTLLANDENISVSSLTQINHGAFLEKDFEGKIDSADILFLLGYPTKDSQQKMTDIVAKVIAEKNIPFFFSLTTTTDLSKLQAIQAYMPVSISSVEDSYQSVQPEIQSGEQNNPLIQNSSANPISAWNNLPPVFKPRSKVNAKPESKIIARAKIDNIPKSDPLIVTRSLGNERSVALLAKDFWRWKLQTSTRNSDVFDSFILNAVRWLNVSDKFRKVKIQPSKKIFAGGEDVEFSAQVYDESLNPVSGADVTISIVHKDQTSGLKLNSVSGGLYEGVFQPDVPGDYSFTATAKADGNLIGEDQGRFNVGEVDIEFLNPGMDYTFLNLLSMETGASYFSPENTSELIAEIKNITENANNEKIVRSEINLWSSEWLLIIAIFILALEWFLRKRSGML